MMDNFIFHKRSFKGLFHYHPMFCHKKSSSIVLFLILFGIDPYITKRICETMRSWPSIFITNFPVTVSTIFRCSIVTIYYLFTLLTSVCIKVASSFSTLSQSFNVSTIWTQTSVPNHRGYYGEFLTAILANNIDFWKCSFHRMII